MRLAKPNMEFQGDLFKHEKIGSILESFVSTISQNPPRGESLGMKCLKEKIMSLFSKTCAVGFPESFPPVIDGFGRSIKPIKKEDSDEFEIVPKKIAEKRANARKQQFKIMSLHQSKSGNICVGESGRFQAKTREICSKP